MKDHNSPEAVEARASQEDPIVMYLIVHESLNMSTGKTAAQCAHASQMLTMRYFEVKDEARILQKKMGGDLSYKCEIGVYPELDAEKQNYIELARQISIMGDWFKSSYRKVVLSSDDKNWLKIKSEFKNQNMVLIIDAGLTEVAAGSETCIGLWPMRKSVVPKLIKRLQTLK